MSFQGYLKEDTATVIPLGPFTDKTDGITYETGMAAAMNHATTGVRISKNGGALAARTTATQPTYDAFGYYLVDLDGTDTGTPGRLKVIFGDAAVCLPCEADFEIVAANVFESLFGVGTTFIKADLTQILAHTMTNTGTQIADAFQTMFDVASPVLTCQSVNQAQDNATTAEIKTALETGMTFATLSVTGQLDAGNLLIDGTTALTGAITAPAGITANLTGNITGTLSTVTTLTNHPATVTVGTNNDKTGYTVSTVSDKTGYALSSTGADLILKSSTFVQAIVAAVNEFATYGLTAINTLLVSTGIKAASIPAATLAANQHVIVDSGTVTTTTNLTNLPSIPANWITATGITDGAITNAKVADDVDVNVKTITNDAITAASINTGAITADAFAAEAITNAAVADDVDVNVKTMSDIDFTATQKTLLNTTGINITQAAADKAWGTSARVLTAATNITAGITDAVWDEVLHVDHEVASSASVLLQAAGGGSDPWAAAEGMAVYAATVTNAAGTDIAADIIAIKADTGLIASVPKKRISVG